MIHGTIAVLLGLGALVGCQPPGDGDLAILRGIVVAGPTCPVVRDPPDPACEDRPVAGAEIVILDARGDEVARVRTDEAGIFTAELPAGEYRLSPRPIEGLLGTPTATDIVVVEGLDPEPVTITYDTGIR
ncbi:MAG: carboxypeptidase regulatory-like domain-containing protein [Chloroflexi bacterium]|nr:carboxypeptidase regulatory-like domain-containing protein [Chloroflexota bacterium]